MHYLFYIYNTKKTFKIAENTYVHKKSRMPNSQVLFSYFYLHEKVFETLQNRHY